MKNKKNKFIIIFLSGIILAFFPLFFVITNVNASCTTFIKDDWERSDLRENQDRITDEIWITRGYSSGLFNAYVRDYFDWRSSPSGTEWYTGECGISPELNIYDTWYNTTAYGDTSTGTKFCLHLITDDLYYDVEILDWTSDAPTSFHISQQNELLEWDELYVQHYQTEYETHDFEFDKINDQVKIRIIQQDIAFGDIEQIKLDACGEIIAPEYARYVESGEDVSFQLEYDDLNVIVNHEKEIELSWSIPESCNNSVIISMKANEYGTANPFLYPKNDYLTFSASHNESIILDGFIDEVENTDSLDTVLWEPITGHPDGDTYIYTSEDDDSLYFSFDITMDNTEDLNEDYLTIITKDRNDIVKEFRVDDEDNTYGLCGFGITNKVSYHHQTCEVVIPKSELSADIDSFSIEYYGTGGGGNGGGFSYERCDASRPTFYPEDNEINVLIYISPTITFDQDVYMGAGNIEIKKVSNDSIIETIDVISGKVTGWGTDTITINPDNNLSYETEFYINIDEGAIKDVDDNEYLGIADNSYWTFTTRPEESDFLFEDDFSDNLKIDLSETDAAWSEYTGNYSLDDYHWVEMDGVTSGYENVSNTSTSSFYSSLELDDFDNPFIAWSDSSGGGYSETFFSRWNGTDWVKADGVSSGYDSLPSGTGHSYNPSVAVDNFNRPVVARYFTPLGSTPQITISRWNGTQWTRMNGSTAGYDNFSLYGHDFHTPDLIMNDSGEAFVTWVSNYWGLFVYHWNGSAWANMDGTGGYNSIVGWSGLKYNPKIALDSNSYPVVTWRGTSDGWKIFATRWNGTEWTEMDGVTPGYEIISGVDSYTPSLVIDENNNIFVAWRWGLGSRKVFVSKWNGIEWTEMDGVTSGYNDLGIGSDPVISLDEKDNPILVWQNINEDTINDIFISRWNGTEWTEMDGVTPGSENISNNDESSSYNDLAVDESGKPFVIWSDDSLGVNDVNISRYVVNYNSPTTIQSIKINGLLEDKILRATLDAESSTPGASRIEYFLSNDGGSTWTEVELGEELTFDEPGNDLRWKAILYEGSTPTLDSITVAYSTESDDEDNEENDDEEEDEEEDIKIKSIQEYCNKLEITVDVENHEKETLDFKVRFENLNSGNYDEITFEDVKTDKNGRAVLILSPLKQNSPYKIKAKYKEGKKRYSDWSKSKKAQTGICQNTYQQEIKEIQETDQRIQEEKPKEENNDENYSSNNNFNNNPDKPSLSQEKESQSIIDSLVKGATSIKEYIKENKAKSFFWLLLLILAVITGRYIWKKTKEEG